MRILVTGASGFAGAYIARYMARRGFDVVATYRRAPGLGAGLEHEPRVAFTQTDLVNPAATLSGPFDGIVHAAATSVWTGIDVDQMVADNVTAMRALLAAAGDWRCRQVVYLSTMSVYGDISVDVVDEATPCVNPDAYGLTKRLAEIMLADRAKDLAGLILRLPAVVGPGARRNWLASSAERLKKGERVRAYNLDAPYNNAVHIDDLSRLAARTLERGWTGCDIAVLGARGQMPVGNVVTLLAAGLGVEPQVEQVPTPKGSFRLSIAHAIDRWGYDPMDIATVIDRYASEV
jgi:UDP-glucose 4-epimerase